MIRWLKTLWPVLLFPIAAHADHIAISFGPSQDGWDIGAKFQHLSNAGIVQPNLGRDFILACIEIGL